jgi:hypothetical protein
VQRVVEPATGQAMNSPPETPAGTTPRGADLVEEMRRRWAVGQRPTAESFLAAHPELQTGPRPPSTWFTRNTSCANRREEHDVEEELFTPLPAIRPNRCASCSIVIVSSWRRTAIG